MNKIITTLLLIPCVFFSLDSGAQCQPDLRVLAPCGPSVTLQARMDKAIQILEWRTVGGTVLRRDTARASEAAFTVAGGNGAGSALNQLNGPSGVFLHPSGALYVSEQAGNRVVKWSPGATSGVVVAGNGTSGSALTNLSAPLGVQVGAGDTVYVLEFGNHRITKWGPGVTQGIVVAGSTTNQSGSADNRLNQPHSFYLHEDGRVTVADLNNNRVIQFPSGSEANTNGTVLVSTSGAMAVTFDQAGNLYVGTSGGKVFRYAPPTYSTPVTVVDGSQRIRGIVVDKYNNIWVTNDQQHVVVRYNANAPTTPLDSLGVSPNATLAPNHLFWPPSLAMDFEKGDLYVADYGNSRIQKFSSVIKDTLTVTADGSYIARYSGYNGCAVEDTVRVDPWISVNASCSDAELTAEVPTVPQFLEWTLAGSGVVRRDTAKMDRFATTVAGGNGKGSGAHQLNDPSGVFLHRSGSLYVSEQSAHRVTRWDPGATQGVRVAGNGTNGTAATNTGSPLGVQVGADDTVYVLEFGNHRISKWGPGATQGIVVAGSTTNQSGSGLDRLNQPHSFYLHDDGRVTVADYNNNRVIQFPSGSTANTSGTVLVSVTLPMAVTFDPAGNLYVGTAGGKVFRYAPPTYSTPVTVVDGNTRIRSIVVDRYNNLWVTNDQQHVVVRYNANAPTTPLDSLGVNPHATSAANHLHWPPSVTMDFTNGDVYVVDYGNARVQKFSPSIEKTYVATAPGTYSVTIKGYNGCTVTKQAAPVNAGSSLAITPGANPSVCTGATSASLPYTVANGTPDQYSIVWNAGATTAGFTNVTNQALTPGAISISVPNGVAAGTYSGTLTVRNSGSGCVSNAYNISVTVTAKPSITPGANPTVCAGATTASLSYSGAAGSPNQYSITWSGAAATAGFLNVTNQSLSGSPISITVPASATGGTYSGTLTVRNSTSGCQSDAYNISVVVNPRPGFTPGSNPEVCAGATVADLSYSGATGTPNQYSIAWSAAATTAGFVDVNNQSLPAGSIALSVPSGVAGGSYTGSLTIRNSTTGCVSDAYSVSVQVHDLPNPSVNTVGPVQICTGFDTVLAATGGSGYTYEWKDASGTVVGTGANYTASTTGQYYLVATGGNNCKDSSSLIDIVVHQLPQVSLAPGDTAFCEGGYVQLEVVTTDTGLSYRWKDGNTTVPLATADFLEVTTSGSYSVVVSRVGVEGCSDSTTPPLNVVVHPLPVPSVTWDGKTLSANSGYSSYQWNINGQPIAGATNATFEPQTDGPYTVTVTDGNGCTNTSDAQPVTVKVSMISRDEILVYPNPVQNLLNIRSSVPVTAVIYGMDGREIMTRSGALLSLDMTQLPNGVYTLSIRDNEGRMVRNERLIKNGNR
jgi:sugar lactone lactonase YvrE